MVPSSAQMFAYLFVLTCIMWAADCKMHHPMWPGRLSYANKIFEKGPDGKFRLAGDRTDSLDSLQEPAKDEEKKITDSAVSFLFALKFYPFRAPFLSFVARDADNEIEEKKDSTTEAAESRQFSDDTPPPEAKDKKNHLGVVALGVDFGLPGDSGFGYGEEWPFKRRLRNRADNDDDGDDDDQDSVSVDSFDDEKR